MQNSFTPINASQAGPSQFALRGRPTQAPSRLDEEYEYMGDKVLESLDKVTKEKGDPWDEEEEVILWEACKKCNSLDNRKAAYPKALAEMRRRGKTSRTLPSLPSKLSRMEGELKECEKIFRLQRGMWWDGNAHRMRGRDKEAEAKFLEAYPEYRKYFGGSRKWATADMQLRPPPQIAGTAQVDNYNHIYDALPPPASGSRKRGRPRKLNRSKGKEPEQPRKRTREASPSASYEPTNRSSRTLSEPFPSLSRSRSPRMVRQTPHIDPLELLQDLARQAVQAQSNVPLNGPYQASGSRSTIPVQYPPNPTVENAPPDDHDDQEHQRSASPPTNRGPGSLTPVMENPPPQEQQQEQRQGPEGQAASAAPLPRSPSLEQDQLRRQQEQAIKQEGSGTRGSPFPLSDDELTSAAVHVPDPYAEPVDVIMAQIEADIKRLPELTQEGRAAMRGLFANEDHGKFYIRAAKHTCVEEHLIYVRDQLSVHYEKRKKNPAALFQRARI